MTEQVTLESACELLTDGTHFTPPNVGTGVPFLTVKDVSEAGLDFRNCSFISDSDFRDAQNANCAPRLGDVLFSKDGTVGKVHVVTTEQPFAVLSSIAILRPHKSRVNSGYLGHVLQSPAVLDAAIRRKTGSAIRRIVLADLKRLQIPLPPLPEQRRIADILDKANALRAKRRSALEQLSRLTLAVFDDMFGCDAPERVTLSEVTTRITDGTHLTPHFTDAGVPFIFVKNVRNGEIDFDTDKFITEADYRSLSERCPVERDDVLYTTVGATYGQAALVGAFTRFSFQRHIAHLKPDVRRIVPAFLAIVMQLPVIKRQADRWARGAAQPTVNLKELREFTCHSRPSHFNMSSQGA